MVPLDSFDNEPLLVNTFVVLAKQILTLEINVVQHLGGQIWFSRAFRVDSAGLFLVMLILKAPLLTGDPQIMSPKSLLNNTTVE